ncbi:MAG: two-component system response regulator [delta proteobacterium MLS_D]|jgi:DNA-binding response OmpR family regulator|nr:MAG: two-component system response regulator [delta proteobacterium MLS_D]
MVDSPVLIVEDDLKIARVMKVYLEGAGFPVLRCERVSEALQAVERQMPLLVLLDLMLPDGKGEDFIEALKTIGDFPVIMVTAKASEEERVAGFAAGADDYIVKPFSPRELVWRVKAVLKRWRKDDLTESTPMSFNNGDLVIDGRTYRVTRQGAPLDLTPTEFKVLFALARSPGTVFSRDQLVERALGYQYEGYDRTVDAHIKNIRRKIEPDAKHPLFILTVYGVGYRFSGNPDV